MGLDCLHFDQRKAKLPLLADLKQCFAFEVTNRNERFFEFVFPSEVETFKFKGAFDNGFDRIVAQQFLNQSLAARFG